MKPETTQTSSAGHLPEQSSAHTSSVDLLESPIAVDSSNFRVKLPFIEPSRRKWRFIAGLSLAAGSIGWIAGIAFAHQTPQAMPWCVTLTLCALFTLQWLIRKRSGSALYLFKIGEHRPLVISEGLAISFVAFSIALGTFLWIDHVSPHPVRTVTRQIVDIELVSSSDAEDRHDILPGTVHKADQQKKVTGSAEADQQGRTLLHTAATPKQQEAAQSKATVTQQNKVEHQQPIQEKKVAVARTQQSAAQRTKQMVNVEMTKKAPVVASGAMKFITHLQPNAPQESFFLHAPSQAPLAQQQPTKTVMQPKTVQSQFKPAVNPNWTTKAIPQPQRIKITQRSRGAASLEEVAPPEMVEMTDSAGETQATELWQSGGHSTGGTGAKSTLATYLKELHRKIKHAWTPPGGESRTAEILFRIKRTGKLGSIKLNRSSGNPEMDDAAMVAVAGCAPFKTLPADFPADYLDLLYTFNYTVDRLAEATKPAIE